LTAAEGDACTLTPDTAFTDQGYLAADEPGVLSVAINKNGHLFFSKTLYDLDGKELFKHTKVIRRPLVEWATSVLINSDQRPYVEWIPFKEDGIQNAKNIDVDVEGVGAGAALEGFLYLVSKPIEGDEPRPQIVSIFHRKPEQIPPRRFSDSSFKLDDHLSDIVNCFQKGNVCAVNATTGKLHAWRSGGKLPAGFVDLAKATGVKAPFQDAKVVNRKTAYALINTQEGDGKPIVSNLFQLKGL